MTLRTHDYLNLDWLATPAGIRAAIDLEMRSRVLGRFPTVTLPAGMPVGFYTYWEWYARAAGKAVTHAQEPGYPTSWTNYPSSTRTVYFDLADHPLNETVLQRGVDVVTMTNLVLDGHPHYIGPLDGVLAIYAAALGYGYAWTHEGLLDRMCLHEDTWVGRVPEGQPSSWPVSTVERTPDWRRRWEEYSGHVFAQYAHRPSKAIAAVR